MKYIATFPPLLIILSHLKFTYKLQPIEIFIFSVSLFLYIYYNDYKVKKLPQKPRTPSYPDKMVEIKLDQHPKSHSLHSGPDTPLKPPVKFSHNHIDTSLELPQKIFVKNFSKPETKSFSYTPSPVGPLSEPSKAFALNNSSHHKEKADSHCKSFFNYIENLHSQSANSVEDLIPLQEVSLLFEELRKHFQNETNKQKVVIESNDEKRIVIDPSQEKYQKEIEKKVEVYKKCVEEAKKKLNKDVATDIKGIVSQITSDVDDLNHLNGRIRAMLEILSHLTGENLKFGLYFLCETVGNRGSDQADSIDLGGNFALNYTKFILIIAKSHNEIHEIYFLALISKKYIFYPLVTTRNSDEIEKRNSLKDLNPNGMLAEMDKEKLTRSMDVCRAYGFLLGTLLASEDSNFNEGDIWRYLVYVLNLKQELIDRAYITFLLGFFKSIAKKLKNSYGKQYEKLIKCFSEDYLAMLTSKFGANSYFRAYITQLREGIKNS